ncbi:hypothetical protein E2C01_063819 [Portunus trituberculatus]|uniref:Uncharacterized protein n=1 Tax=Portunus trituberculatus TaxID=210409 RepID=A0A5B7HIN9_PORTR|nr:hypothetical protein [Portunus trituberculatus]
MSVASRRDLRGARSPRLGAAAIMAAYCCYRSLPDNDSTPETTGLTPPHSSGTFQSPARPSPQCNPRPRPAAALSAAATQLGSTRPAHHEARGEGALGEAAGRAGEGEQGRGKRDKPCSLHYLPPT